MRRILFAIVSLVFFGIPFHLCAYNVGDITDDWTMLNGDQTISYRLYDYQGKLVLVNLFRDD